MVKPKQDNSLFLIEGTLSNLHWELGSANLLEKVQKHYRRNAAITGAGAVVGDLFGQAANAAMLAMYDGEDTQHFVCLIDEQVACGQFAGAEHLPEGGQIKAVASRKGEALYVHAAMDEARGMLWIHYPWGTRAEMWSNFRIAWYAYISLNVFWAAMILFFGGRGSFWSDMLYPIFWGACLCLVVALWANKDLKALAGPSTEIFRLLGFEYPERVGLRNYMWYYKVYRDYLKNEMLIPSGWNDMSAYQYHEVYSVKHAIADGKVKLKPNNAREASA